MNIIQLPNNLQLLLSFDRGYAVGNPNDPENLEINREIVKCHLWFSDGKELQNFLKEHREFPAPAISQKKNKIVKWVDFTTKTKEELGMKE